MGLIAGTVNKQYLIAYRNELEYKMSLIRQSRMSLDQTTSDLLNAGTDMDPENPAVKQLEQRRERLNLLDKKLEMQMEEYKTKLEMVNANIEAADEMIKSSLKR